MSVQALSAAIALRGVTASEKLLLMVLANYADDKMACFPSHRLLSEDTGLTERTILRLMHGLETRGTINRRERRRPDGSRSTDLITLDFSGGGETISPRGDIDGAEVGKPCRGGGEMVSPPTTFEPPINHQKYEPSQSVKARRAVRRCPSDWLPSDGDLEVGAQVGLTPGEIDRELAKMRDFEFRNPRSDWSAVTRNWFRTAAERNPRQANGRHPEPSPAFIRKQANMARAFAASQRVPAAE